MPTALSFPTITGVTGAPNMPDLTETADIQVALKYLYFGSGGVASNSAGIYGALQRLYVGDPTLAGNVTITGNLTVNGTTTTINSTTINVDDILLELGAVTTPSNTTANGGGISLLGGGGGNKTITWANDTNNNWTSSENFNLVSGRTYKINNVTLLDTNAPKSMATLMGYTSTVTSGTAVVLTNTSSYYQQFTGSTAQTITLPVTSTLITGWTFHIVNNNSSGNLTVNSSGGNLVITVPPGTTAMLTCIGTTLTTAADWESGLTDFSTYTGTGNVVMSASPVLTTPTIDTINTSITTTGTAALFNSGITTGTISIGGSLTSGAINIGTGTAGTKTIGIGTSTGTNTLNGTTNIANTFQLGGTSVTTTATRLNYLTSAGGTTGTTSTNVVFSTSPTLTTPVVNGPTYASTTISSATTLTTSNDIVHLLAPGGVGYTLTLPTPTAGKILYLNRTDNSAGTITVSGHINGTPATSNTSWFPASTSNRRAMLVSDGTSWYPMIAGAVS